MQTDHQVPTVMRPQHRKRSYSNGNFRKRDRHDLICVVCHAPAMGYNFDQITCESCKAFFRRNALNDTDKLKCRVGTNDCVITLETRKRCKFCRLKKCFEKGLRKEWIMSEEEKRTKKQKIEDNRRLRAVSQSLSMLSTPTSHSPLILSNESYAQFSFQATSDDDSSNDFKYSLEKHQQTILTKMEERYTQAVRLNISLIEGFDSPCLRNLNDLVECLNEPAHISTLRLITFFKLTPEFHSLHEDDRLTLVKHNVLSMLYIHFYMCTDIVTGIFHEPNTPNDCGYDANVLRQYSDAIYYKTMRLTEEMQQICAKDPLIIKLLMLIMLFSKGADPMEPVLINPIKVFSAQNLFVDLLWNYLDVRFGSDQSATVFSRLIFSLLKTHSLARETKANVARRTVQIDELAPLMQSVLQIL